MSVVAIIPARGGSTRIPAKNLALLDQRPLVAHTIDAALTARLVDAVYVSTNDAEIARVSRHHGARVVMRPDHLSTSEAPTEPALQHAVQEIERRQGERVELIVMLQPTSPLRGAGRIDEGVRLLRSGDWDAVVSVVPDVGYYFLGDIGAGGELRVGYDPHNRLRTQDIPPRYRENGAVYVTTRRLLMERGCRMGGRMAALVMDEKESIDIDTPLELELCRVLLERRPGRWKRPAPLAVSFP